MHIFTKKWYYLSSFIPIFAKGRYEQLFYYFSYLKLIA
jgi:hypothetical protein